MPEREWQDITWRCERWLGQRRPATAAELLRAAADALPLNIGEPALEISAQEAAELFASVVATSS